MPDHGELVTIFESSNLALLAVARSVLDSAAIIYSIKGQSIQTLFGVGLVRIQVRREDREAAQELLTGIREAEADDE
jgi:hypothetical protein